MRRMATLTALATLLVAASTVATVVSPAGAAGYHGCATFITGGQGVTHIRVKRTNCRTARLVLRRHGHRPGWNCHNLPSRYGQPVVCKHGGGKVIRAYYAE